MRLLFSAWRAAYLKNHESIVTELARRGHTVEILLEEPDRYVRGQEPMLEALRALPNVSFVDGTPKRHERWRELSQDLRLARSHLEFLDTTFSEQYSVRSEKRAPRPLRRLLTSAGVLSSIARHGSGRRLLIRALERVERAIPPSPELVGLLRSHRPDALLLTPVVALRSPQHTLLRAARSIGVPNAVAVHSWDNLSSKALVRPVPDRLLVWNGKQREEAEERHGIDASRIVVTGAHCYDDLPGASVRSRADFCTRVGLDPSRPFVVYGCSAPWTFRPETDFVFRWLDAIRGHGGPLGEAGVLIRPHPKRPENWATADVSAWPNVVVWPRVAEFPTGGDAKLDYVDSLTHAAALVAVNTSAMIEAGACNTPALTILQPDLSAVQDETIHFRYLLDADTGLLTVGRSLDEHVDQLAETLTDPGRARARAAAFSAWFLHPQGSGIRATDVFVDAIEALASAPPTADRRSVFLDPLLRGALRAGMVAYDSLRWVSRLRRRLMTK